jgi:hypothetical protein
MRLAYELVIFAALRALPCGRKSHRSGSNRVVNQTCYHIKSKNQLEQEGRGDLNYNARISGKGLYRGKCRLGCTITYVSTVLWKK